MRFALAQLLLGVSAADIGLWAFTAVGMGALGFVAWRVLQRQESKDPTFLKKLDDDDARARGDLPPSPSSKSERTP
ncbi:MAG: hypothetical protein JNL80_14070 [Phycisphaerae bacterium]|jgi:hypothetical protein|nr:hypothetical protein [Phycisphaerae bacterium]